MKGRFAKCLKYAKYAAFIMLGSSFIKGPLIDAAHYEIFGKSGKMMFSETTNEAPTKVAVTTCNVRDSSCSIITSYNKRTVDHSKPYKWLQSKDQHLGVKVWEA
jgi:hypothetical protein